MSSASRSTPSGKLISGESFSNIQELKHILATGHAKLFYETLTEKILTYALGRGLEYYDVESVDRIIEQLERSNGRFSAALMGVIESAPFQRTRRSESMLSKDRLKTQQAALGTKP